MSVLLLPLEEAQCRTGVAPVDELEKAADDDFFLVYRERFQHEPFGGLVERKNYQRQRGDAPVRFLKNGLGGGHSRKSKV